MFIDSKKVDGIDIVDIYPFAENKQDSFWQTRITVRDGQVWWNGKPVTAEEMIIRYGKMLDAFGKAFEIAGEGDDGNL